MKSKIKEIKKQFSFKLDRYFFKNLLIVTAVVFIWRGIWNLIDIYFLPSNELISNVLTILIGLFLLYLPDSEDGSHPSDRMT